MSQRGQERGFSLARRGGSRDDEIAVGLEDERDGFFLGIPQGLPALGPDEALDALVEQMERG
jgi:hypothetical protein